MLSVQGINSGKISNDPIEKKQELSQKKLHNLHQVSQMSHVENFHTLTGAKQTSSQIFQRAFITFLLCWMLKKTP